ncbi:MAG: ABC transporter substrate-binding protein [Candidatus Atribacteria bacterium]|nr:ABC transporter substrate-binding protein [Candidatus Atribacteria bacterium]
MKRTFWFGILLVIFFSISVPVFGQDTVKIGANLEMTGGVAAYGQMINEGVELIREIVGTEVLGKQIEYVLVDNKSDKVEAANATTRLIDKEKVVAIIGPAISGNMLAAGPICEEKKVPQLSATSTNPLVTQGKKYSFRATFIDSYQGLAGAQYAYKDLGAKTAAILSDIAQDYCVALGNFFKDAYEKMGGKVLTVQHCKTGDQDFSAQLTTILNLNPDVIYLPNYYAEIALICRQARDLGYEGKILGGDGSDAPELVDIGGDAVEGFYFTAHGDTQKALTEIGQKYFDAYRAKYNKEPGVFGALAADCYLIILDAIKRANSFDPEKIAVAIEDTKDLEVTTGKITIENGDALKPVVVKQVQGGIAKLLGTIQVE